MIMKMTIAASLRTELQNSSSPKPRTPKMLMITGSTRKTVGVVLACD
jgi:hypothetical protein